MNILVQIEKVLDSLARRPIWPAHKAPRSPQGLPYASFNRRMMASMVDAAVLSLIMWPFNDAIMQYVYATVHLNLNSEEMTQALHPENANKLMVQLVAVALMLAQIQYVTLAVFSFICWHFWSATPGKLVLGLRIVDARTGNKITDWQSFLRVIGYIVSAVPMMLGFFAICWNKQRRGWHDQIAGTVVVVGVQSQKEMAAEAAEPQTAPSEAKDI